MAESIALLANHDQDIWITNPKAGCTMEMLAIAEHVMKGLRVNEAACKSAMSEELFATEEAYRLVREGMPFREAYRKVGLKYSGGEES